MIELNEGLALKKYGESQYGQIRRLIIANPLSRSQATSAFLKGWDFTYCSGNPKDMYPGDKKFTGEDLKELLITQLEPVVSTNKVYLYGSARKNPVCEHTAPLKNCPSCSKAIYHNTLFQFKWAKCCPLHGEQLVTKCPECGRQWPSLSELLDRDCLACGIRHSIEELNANSAFNRDQYQKTFEPYQQLIDSYTEVGEMNMTGMRPYKVFESYGLDDVNSSDFPSLVAAFSPNRKCMLEKVTSIDRVYRVRKFKHAGIEAKVTDRAEREKCDRIWAREVFSKVDLEVLLLLSYTDEAHHQHQLLNSYSEADCPYCLAYSVWSHLSRARISESPDEEINPQFGKDLWRLNDGVEWAPVGVHPHFCLTNTKFQLRWEQENKRPSEAPLVDVPLHISKRIYRLLLWKSFENICLFLLHRARLTGYSSTGYLIPSSLMNFMPARALPTNAWLHKVAMREPGDDCVIEMALPDDVVMAPLLVDDEARWIYSEYLRQRKQFNKYYPMYFVNNGPKTDSAYSHYMKFKARHRNNSWNQIAFPSLSGQTWGDIKPL